MRQPAAVLLAHAWRNDQFGQFFANSFLSAKTKHALGGWIKFEDPTICVHGNDAIELRYRECRDTAFRAHRSGQVCCFWAVGLDLIRSAPALRETNKFDAERAIALRGKRAILTAG